MSKRPKPFNNPFAALQGTVQPKPSGPAKAPVGASPRGPDPEDEAAYFRAAVGEVEPVRKGATRVAPPPRMPGPDVLDDETEALAALSDLVTGEGSIELREIDGHLEGVVPGLDGGLLRKLKAGELAIQGRLDLHGMTQKEARPALETFIAAARQGKQRCVLVVHGRGLHSEAGQPVLKEALGGWLSRGRLARIVLAFCSARPSDGGPGAVYVLLRK